jgi:hypothetical protein
MILSHSGPHGETVHGHTFGHTGRFYGAAIRSQEATVTITTMHTPDSTHAVPGQRNLEAAADTLLNAMTEAGLDDPGWESAGPLVSEAAQRLREALGTPVRGSCVSVPAVVREADFALATRPLLGEAVVVDAEAARQFVRLAFEAALALG